MTTVPEKKKDNESVGAMQKAPNYMTWKDEDLVTKASALGIDPEIFIVDDKLNRKEIVYMIKFVETKTGAGDETLVAEDVKDKPRIRGLKPGEHAVKIIFHNSDENDLPYVSIGLNGKAYYIPKGREVWIPKALLDGPIKDAVMDKMKMEVDQQGHIHYVKQPVPRFVYQVVDIV
jgi:hypothetical protein